MLLFLKLQKVSKLFVQQLYAKLSQIYNLIFKIIASLSLIANSQNFKSHLLQGIYKQLVYDSQILYDICQLKTFQNKEKIRFRNFSFYQQIINSISIIFIILMNFALGKKILQPQFKYNSTLDFMNSIFKNERVQQTLNQIDSKLRNSHRSFHTSRKNKQNVSQRKQTFRTFTRERRSYIPAVQRKKYINLKQQMIKFQQYFEQKSSQFQMNQFYQMKQKIMLGFLNNFIDDLSKQNLEKAQLLVLVWSNMMLLVQKSLQNICKSNKDSQKINLKYQTNMHLKYQSVLQECITKKKQALQQNNKKQRFMKVLVAKIRQYKKQIKKMEDNLRMAASKLNQFRQGYLEIQIQCIDLTMELRNLGEETAKMMVQKKMALALEKSKQYKILQSKKKRKLQLKKQKIQVNNNQNDKIKQQFYDAFKCNINQKPQAINKIVGRLIQAILDKQQSQPINYSIFNENLVQNKYSEEGNADKATDMTGFTIDKADKKVGINPQERFISQMTKMRGVQTLTIQKPPPIKMQTLGLQCQFKTLVSHQLGIMKTVDLSFLFQNTLKSSNAKRQNFRFKSFRDIPDKSRKKIIDIDSIYNNLDLQVKQVQSQNESEVSSTQIMKENTNQSTLKMEPIKTEVLNSANTGKRIKKINSTFSNKVSFLANMEQRFFRKQSQQKNDMKQNEQVKRNISQMSDELNLIHEQEQNGQINKLGKKMSNKSLKTYKKIRNQNAISQRQSRFRTKNQSKLLRQQNSMKKQKQKDKLRKQKQQKSLAMIGHLFQSIKSQSKSAHTYAHDLIKQIKLDLDEIYEDVSLQLSKVKNLITAAKNQNKIKDLGRIIQSIIILAIRDYDIAMKSKNFFYYIYQVINNLYGITSNSYLRKRVISFVKQVFYYKHQNTILCLFLAMIGLDEKGYRLHQYSTKNNDILIRLMRRICVNFKVPFKLEQLRINTQSLWANLNQQLVKSGFCDSTAFEIMQKIQRLNFASITSKSQQIFCILYAMNQHLIQQQSTIVNSYQPIINLIATVNQPISKELIQFFLQLHFLPHRTKSTIFQKLNQLYSQKQNGEIDRAAFAYFCCQNHLLDFSRLFHRALNLFQIKQSDDACKNITASKLKQIKIPNMPQKLLQKIYFECGHLSQTNGLFHALIKKNLLILIFLKAQQQRCEEVLKKLIGSLYYQN